MSDLYRKTALDKLSSPEQLDKMIEITSPMFWIAALGGGIIFVTALFWSIFARLPINVQSNGIFISKDGVQTVYSENTGIVKEIFVSKGENVTEGTVIARFDTENTESKLKKLETRRTDIETVTIDSTGDTATADNKELLDIKSRLTTVSADLTRDKDMLDLREKQLKDQRAKTNSALSEMQLARTLYYAAMNTGSATREQIAFQQAQSDLSAAQSYYEGSVSSRGSFNAQSDEQIDQLKDDIKKLKKKRDSLDKNDPNYQSNYDSLQSEIESLGSQRETLKDQKRYYEEYGDDREQKLRNAEAAFYNAAQAYIDSEQLQLARQTFANQLNDNYSTALQNYNTELSQLRSYENTVSELLVQVSSEDRNLNDQYDSLKSQFEGTKAAVLDNLDREIRDTRKELENYEIRSTLSGYVLGVEVVVGSPVQAGSPVCRLSQTEKSIDMEAGAAGKDGADTEAFKGSIQSSNVVECYVPIAEGKKIKPGMETFIYPSTVNRQEQGHISGRVTDVADFVTSVEDVRNQLGDDSLVQAFTGKGPVVLVTCELDEDPATASGYKWSSKKGATVELDPGTMVSVDIVTEEKAPITMLIPLLKEKLSVQKENPANE